MGKFSYDDYMNLKKKGLVSWDDDLIKGHSKNLNDFVKGTSSLTEESFDDNVSKLRELEDQHRYVQTYINSLEGSGSYNGAKRSFDSIDATLNKAKGFYGQFKDSKAYGEALKQQKEAQAAQAANAKKSGQRQEEAEQKQDTRSAQEYYDTEITSVQNKKDAAAKRMAKLDEIYRQNKYSTPEMQDEYAKLRKTVDEYDSEINSKKKIYNQKKQAEKDENDKINARENNKRYAQKYDGASLNSLIQAYIDSDSESEKDWIKEAIKSNKHVIDKEGNTTGFSSDEVKSAMNNLYERGKEEADRVNAAYEYDGYEDTKQETINHFQSKYGDAAYMLENLLHGKRRSETKEKYTEEYKNAVNSKKYDNNSVTRVQERDTRDDLDNKKYMTDEEYSVYTYLLNNRREDDAEKFFNAIKPELNQRMTQAQAQKEYELGNEGFGGAVLASLKSLGYNVISGGGIIEDVVNYATHNEIDTNSMLHMPSHLGDTDREGVSDLIGEDNPVGQWIYGTLMSVADNAINLAISKGIGKIGGVVGNLGKLSAGAETVNRISSTAASVIMGSQVATQTVIDCKDQGMDDGTAIGLGLIHGLVEHITEKVSIESILSDPRTFKQALKKSFVSEGSEEVAANWLDRAADALIMGDKSKERQDFENFKAQGMNDIEAFGQVMLGCLGEDAEAFLAGGVSGIVMSGVSHGFDKVTKGIVKGNEFNKIAEEASKKTDFDERKKELIKEAKESGDKKAVKMAESFERTIERHNGDLSAIKVGDVANIMRVLDDARQNAIESGNEAAAEQQSTVDSIIESSARTMERSKIANKSFNDIGLGAVKGKRVNLNAFGASHPKGIRVTQNSNPSISHDIVRIESSAKEYGEKENTVVLKTSDGRYINADEVTMPTKTYDTLIREAKNYDTNGARGLLANYEGYADYCKRSGKEADVKEYIQQYDALYDLGRHGVRAESMRTGGSARFNSIADAIGIEQAENALNTGANDADAVFMHENNVMLKMRMPGQKHAADSKVVIDVSEGEELNISDDQKNILQAIAQKTGRTIVLTDKLSENVSGTFAPDGKIYINSKIENSNYGVAVALHEAIHGLRTAAPMEYNALKKFIVNYLVEQGENIDDLLDDIALNWGKDAASEEARLEELVAQSVMALATDDAALKKAIECKENKKLLNKVLDAIKSIAEKVREFIKGTLKDGKITGAHNKQAQFWTENLKALDELAEKFSKAMDEQRVNVREYGQKNNTSGEVRYSKKENGTRNVEQKNSSVIKTANDSIDAESADPVTYDDNGNVIPLSERFKSNNNDIRYAVDDTIYDDLFDTDGDLFEPENKEYLDKFIKTSPDEATLSMYNSLSKTGESVIKEFKGIKLSDENYRKAARRLMKDYDIKLKLNPGTDVELADRIKNFVLWFEKNPNANYNEALNVLADDCKGFLLLSGDYVDSFKEERQDLLSRLKGRTLVLRSYEEDQILENFGGIKGLRRAFFGKANVGYEKNAKGKPKVYIEDLVEEFSEQWGKNWASEDDIDSFAGWAWLDNMLNNVLKPKFVNPYTDGEMSLYRSIDAVAVEMAMQITDELVKEKADAAAKSKSADKKLITELRKKERAAHSAKEALEKSKREKYKKLADEEKRKRIEMSEHYSDKYKDSERKRIEQNERFRERIREVEGKNKEYRRIIFDSEKSIRERYIEAREKTRYRKLLAKEFERMTKRLDGKANNNEYIPEKLKKPIKEFLSLFEILPEKGKLPSYWGEYRRISDIGAKIDELASEYEKLGSTGKTETHFGMTFNADTVGYDESIKNELRELAGQIRNKNVYALTAEELKAVYEGMRVLDQSLRKAVEIIVDEKRENINELARKAVEETQGINFKKGNSVTQIKDYALATHLDPVRYGRFLSGYHDDYVVAKLFRDLHEGDKNQVRIMYRAFVELERTLDSEFSENERKNLQTKDIESFDFTDTVTGKRVKISDAMLLSIYLTDRQADGHRQLTNDKANHYTRLPDLDTANRENVAVVGKTAASLTKSNEKAVGEKSHRVRFTEADLRQIREYIENDRKLYKLAEAVSSVFNGIIKDEINKVSLQREGRMIATVKNYFPLATDKEYPGKKFEVEIGESLKDLRLRSRAFTKQRSYAYNALMIDDVFKVFLKHVQETAEYCGMIIPVENFKRVFGKGNDNIVLSEAIKQKFGSAATHYISKLMDDIQAPKNKLDENIITRLHGNYMGAVLMINPGAAIKQFAAFPTAFKYFGVSNVTKAVPVSLAKGKSLVEKYSEYTPYMWYRENGNGTIIAETSRQLSLTGKTESWLDIMGKVDRFVVNSLLYAAEEHVRQTRSDLEFDSDEFKKEVARQFERAVDESQPNNMVTSKPQFVRNQALRMLSMNAFISQNMAMGNGIIDSGMEFAARLSDYKANKNAENAEAAKKAAKGFASHIVGTLLSSGLLKALEILAALFFYHKWDDTKDEEGKTSWNKICEQWLSGIGENFAGAFAQGDTIYRIMTGKWENLEVMSLSAINDIAKSVKSGDIVKAWGRIADALGLPLVLGNNIQRNVRGLLLTASDLFNGSYPIGGGHSIYKNNGELDTKYFGYYIADYMKQGNKEEAEKYINLWKGELMNQGKSEDEATQDIKKNLADVLAKTDDDVTDAFVAYTNGDFKKYDALYEKLHGYGFDQTDVEKAVNKVKGQIFAAMKDAGVEADEAKDDLVAQGFNEKAAGKLAEEYNKEPEEQPDDVLSDTGEGKKYKKADAFKAFASGDKEAYEDIKDYLVEKGKVEDGEKLDKDMQSLTYTGKLIDSYLKALDAEYKDKSQKENREELKKQLLNIYGSWDKASAAIKKRQKQKQKK